MNLIPVLPRVRIQVEGTPFDHEKLGILSDLRVHQELSVPTVCELGFFEPEDPGGITAAFSPGTAFQVFIEPQQAVLFKGEVTALEHVFGPTRGREIRIRGYDLLHRLRKRQPVRVHVQVSCEDLARELVSDLGLSVISSEAGPVWQKLIQDHQSDLELLGEVAGRCGLYFSLREDALHLFTLKGSGEALPLILGESLLEARLEFNGDPACRRVRAEGWDPSRVLAYQGGADMARSGYEILGELDPGRLGGTGERFLSGETVQNSSQAEAIAQGELDLRVGREVTFEGIAEGDTRLQPGLPIQLKGLDSVLPDQFVLTAVTHQVDGHRGYISELITAPPPPPARRRGTVMALGIVTRVNDPDGLGRVQVSLPAYGGVETDWLSVLTVGAGAGKGLVALPDVEDQVLVLFAREDPAQGVVLGGLYGEKEAPDWGVEKESIKRFTLQTPGGQRVQLDDSKNLIRLENSLGSYLELTPDQILLHAACELEIRAPGKPIVIRGQNIDFKRG